MNVISRNLDRRGFLAGAGAMDVGTAVARGAGAGTFTLDDQQPFRGQTRRLKITRSSWPVASLIFPTDYPAPRGVQKERTIRFRHTS